MLLLCYYFHFSSHIIGATASCNYSFYKNSVISPKCHKTSRLQLSSYLERKIILIIKKSINKSMRQKTEKNYKPGRDLQCNCRRFCLSSSCLDFLMIFQNKCTISIISTILGHLTYPIVTLRKKIEVDKKIFYLI